MIEINDYNRFAYCEDCYQEFPVAKYITYHDGLGIRKILPMAPEDGREGGTNIGFVTMSKKPKRFLCIECCPEIVSLYGLLFRKNTSGCFIELGETRPYTSRITEKPVIIKPQLIRRTQL